MEPALNASETASLEKIELVATTEAKEVVEK